MTRSSDAEGGTKSWSEEDARSLLRIASSLQRALNTGRIPEYRLRAADRQLSRNLAAYLTHSLHTLDKFMAKAGSEGIRKKAHDLYLKLMSVISEMRTMEDMGYSTLSKRGRVDPGKMNQLLGLDTELSRSIWNLAECVERLSSRHTFSQPDYVEASHLVEDILALLKKRRTLVGCKR